MNNGQLETIDLENLDCVSGGGWKSKAFKAVKDGASWVGKQFGAGVGEGIKTTGKVTTAGALTEGGSRAFEGATGVRTPRPSDIVTGVGK